MQVSLFPAILTLGRMQIESYWWSSVSLLGRSQSENEANKEGSRSMYQKETY